MLMINDHDDHDDHDDFDDHDDYDDHDKLQIMSIPCRVAPMQAPTS